MPVENAVQPKKKDLMDIIDETKIMLPFFLGGKIADVGSTIYVVNRIGIEAEQNIWLKELMRQNGPLTGNLIQSSLTLPLWMLAAYGLNRLGDHFDIKLKMGNLVIYGLIGGGLYSIAAQNLIFNYFK
ncbi:MAG: hypothetical protein AABX70_02955 [Nanoarchaeota archaeon]